MRVHLLWPNYEQLQAVCSHLPGGDAKKYGQASLSYCVLCMESAAEGGEGGTPKRKAKLQQTERGCHFGATCLVAAYPTEATGGRKAKEAETTQKQKGRASHVANNPSGDTQC